MTVFSKLQRKIAKAQKLLDEAKAECDGYLSTTIGGEYVDRVRWIQHQMVVGSAACNHAIETTNMP